MALSPTRTPPRIFIGRKIEEDVVVSPLSAITIESPFPDRISPPPGRPAAAATPTIMTRRRSHSIESFESAPSSPMPKPSPLATSSNTPLPSGGLGEEALPVGIKPMSPRQHQPSAASRILSLGEPGGATPPGEAGEVLYIPRDFVNLEIEMNRSDREWHVVGEFYELQELLGEGGWGKVYAGLRLRDQTTHALKIIKKSDIDWKLLSREVEILQQ